jgi:diguanylate cyclase (GGDEF)-like protein
MNNPEAPLSIVLGEDHPPHAARLRDLLAGGPAADFVIETFANLADLMRFLRRITPDLILLDVDLPGLQDPTEIRSVSERAPHVPIVGLLGGDDTGGVERALAGGAHDFLVRGFPDRELLLRTVRYASRQRRLRLGWQEARRELEILSYEDPLTKLLNRRGIERSLTREVCRCQRSGSLLLMLLVDLDNFRRINESLGRGVGDMALIRAGCRIRETVRQSDEVGRAGDDQYVVLLPEIRAAEGLIIAERIRLAIAQDVIKVGGKMVRLTASVGMTAVPPETLSLSEALAKAHVALHRCKTLGKNRVACAINHGDSHLARPVVISRDMVRALLYDDVFHVASQPIVEIEDGRRISRELLIRGPQGPLHGPDELFRFSLEQDILTPIDLRCLKECVAAARLDGIDGSNHVNIMPSTLLETPTEGLIDLLATHSRPDHYCLEISEQQLLGDPSCLAPAVQSLQKRGVQVAIDDVGFGHSCLESLVVLRPEIMKIDKRMIIGVSQDSGMRRRLQRLLQVARVLETEVIAEGIETAEDLAVLRDLGVRLGQGYYFGRPEICKVASVKAATVGPATVEISDFEAPCVESTAEVPQAASVIPV